MGLRAHARMETVAAASVVAFRRPLPRRTRTTWPRLGVAAQRGPAPRPQTNPSLPGCRRRIQWQTGVVHLNKPLFALRADASGGRAYGVGYGQKQRPVLDLRGEQIALAGSHSVSGWVQRRDSGTLRLKQQGALAVLARVVP